MNLFSFNTCYMYFSRKMSIVAYFDNTTITNPYIYIL